MTEPQHCKRTCIWWSDDPEMGYCYKWERPTTEKALCTAFEEGRFDPETGNVVAKARKD